jgi:hypothetical protein
MTICIAALCDDGKNCIVGADREITATSLSLEFDHEKKIEVLTGPCVVMASGDSLLAVEVIEKTQDKILPLADKTVRNIAETLKNVYMATHLERAESVILRPRGLTLIEYQQNGAQRLPLQIYLNIDQQFWTFGLAVVEFLVAGVDATGAHIFRIHYDGIAGGSWLEWCDRLGFRAIGSGAMHSSILLSLEEHTRQATIDQAIYNVYAAKKSAEVAPGVGPSTDVAVVTLSGVTFLTKDTFEKLNSVRTDALKNRRVDPEVIRGLYETK